MLHDAGHFLALVIPAMALLLALSFLFAWHHERTRPYLLQVGACYLLYAMAIGMQILWPPRAGAGHATVIGALYLGSAVLLLHGMLARIGARPGRCAVVALPLALCGMLAWFELVQPSLVARVYIVNVGMALILLLGIAPLAGLRKGRTVDRVLFWVFVGFALQFLPRTVLTLAPAGVADAAALPRTAYGLWLQPTLALLLLTLALALLAATAQDVIDGLRHERDTDPLTQLHTRRSLETLAARQIPPRPGEPLSVVLCDLDFFKFINDNYGHGAGDAVLTQVGHIIAAGIRRRDIAARLGGEEFVVLLPDTPHDSALQLAERLRQTLEQASIDALPGMRKVTASFGVATLRPGEDLEALLLRADNVLYTAKNNGRNCVEWEREPGLAVLP
ncbi:GGDEF domain-containing protein [Cupriavidus necator]|uniref:GGDEF domain-containing protein n=1 Tax=Cupriavidus necator TaxID=106590 RepID=UPI00277F1B50|nr:GGDEF domain-containing protein [Cupriavidus necator]MDQ0141062.1 diguanylate cyclase (GGDEF)-like protein [Cupriavidus necator]